MYRSHPSMGKAGKYGARSNAEPQHEELGRDGGQGTAWACRLGLQLDYSTRRAVLAHDVTLERRGGWAVGLSACLLFPCTVVHCGRPITCRPAALIRKTATGFVGRPTNILPVFWPKTRPMTVMSPANRRNKTRNMPAQGLPTLSHEPKIFIDEAAPPSTVEYCLQHTQHTQHITCRANAPGAPIRIFNQSRSATNLDVNGPYRRAYTLSTSKLSRQIADTSCIKSDEIIGSDNR